MPFALKLAVLYTAINALIMLALGANVIIMRRRTRTRLGDEGKPQMQQAIRAHANNTEYVPIALILLLLAQHLGADVTLIHTMGLTLTVGRIIHASALLKSDFWTGSSQARTLGMVLTQFSILTGVVACLTMAFSAPA